MSNFIREGKSGGCAVGTPPDHLGFRLVRDGQRMPRLVRLGRTISEHPVPVMEALKTITRSENDAYE